MTERSEKDRQAMADPRYTERPIACQHCKHLVSMGNQFDEEGWTCKAYPEQIPYRVLTMMDPHLKPSLGQTLDKDDSVFDPIIYKEKDTGKEWHYTADGDWKYLKQ